MNLQTIKSISGQDEYILLPIGAYRVLKKQIDKVVQGDYEKFHLNDYVKNPVALIRIQARLTQEELARYLKVSQAYISKIESKESIPPKLLEKIRILLQDKKLI